MQQQHLTPSHAGENHWKLITGTLVRFGLCFFLLYALFGGNASLLALLPIVGMRVDVEIRRPVDLLVQWVGIHIFHLTGLTATLHIQATSDSALRWVEIAVLLGASIAATVVWIACSRIRDQDGELLGWLRLLVRITLGAALLRYGFIKVYPIQFPPPPLAVLNETVGNSSPTMLFWSVYGLNPAFVMTLGWTEVVVGLLLFFRRTAFLGAVLALGVMANVALLDVSFDVPVKLYSLSLVVMALVLLSPELAMLIQLFLTDGPVTRASTWSPTGFGKLGRTALIAAELLIAVLACWQYAAGARSVWEMKAAASRNPSSLTGEWAIPASEKALRAGNGSLIVAIFFDPNSDTYFRAEDGSLWRSRAVYDPAHQRLRILYEVAGVLLFTVEQPDSDHLSLKPEGPTAAQLTIFHLSRVPLPQSYPLLQHKFHWTNEFGELR